MFEKLNMTNYIYFCKNKLFNLLQVLLHISVLLS
jgi:hypothetical protein